MVWNLFFCDLMRGSVVLVRSTTIHKITTRYITARVDSMTVHCPSTQQYQRIATDLSTKIAASGRRCEMVNNIRSYYIDIRSLAEKRDKKRDQTYIFEVKIRLPCR